MPQNPWPGLVAFTEELREFFHGRAEEADELLRRVERKNLTVLFGQSGLGKSSLLQAGLFPRLRAEGYLPVAIRLDHAAAAPPLSEQVMAAGAACHPAMPGGRFEATAADAGESLWEYFHRRSLLLQTADGRPVRPVLVFDQFEELFAIGQASEETRAGACPFPHRTGRPGREPGAGGARAPPRGQPRAGQAVHLRRSRLPDARLLARGLSAAIWKVCGHRCRRSPRTGCG